MPPLLRKLADIQSRRLIIGEKYQNPPLPEMAEDRISNLPDAILQDILSSIDLKHAVQTCIISKRWRNLWSSLPNIDFNFSRLAAGSGVDLAWSRHNRNFMPRFTHFATQFLTHRDGGVLVSKFQLSSSQMAATDSKFVEKCIDYAIAHGVQTLILDAYCSPTPVNFPKCFCASETLTILKLKQYTDSIIIPKPFTLPNLKTLYLESFKFDDNGGLYGFPKEPFSNFSNLEELTLHRCDISGLIISSLKLKNLQISFADPLFSREMKMEQISTPGLNSFRYEGYVSLVCEKVDFSSLEEVYLDCFATLESPYTDGVKRKMSLNLIKMMQQLGNARYVTLTLHTIEVLAMNPHFLEQSPSPFPNIKHLKLTKRSNIIHPMKNVPWTVMNYLTNGSHSLVVEFPKGIKR